MKLPDGVELKDDAKHSPSESSMSDSLKNLLTEALGSTAEAAQRARCLDMALKLPGLNGPEEAIKAADTFLKYIKEGAK